MVALQNRFVCYWKHQGWLITIAVHGESCKFTHCDAQKIVLFLIAMCCVYWRCICKQLLPPHPPIVLYCVYSRSSPDTKTRAASGPVFDSRGLSTLASVSLCNPLTVHTPLPIRRHNRAGTARAITHTLFSITSKFEVTKSHKLLNAETGVTLWHLNFGLNKIKMSKGQFLLRDNNTVGVCDFGNEDRCTLVSDR